MEKFYGKKFLYNRAASTESLNKIFRSQRIFFIKVIGIVLQAHKVEDNYFNFTVSRVFRVHRVISCNISLKVRNERVSK